MASPLRGGGGAKAGTIRKEELFFEKNMALLVKKLGEKKSCKNPFLGILRLKKFRWP
mgnify:CR=1 FL=1